MAFVNLSMLLGGLFMAIPIVIHLTMRRQPKRQPFPAIQFLKERRDSNQKKLQLRHWLLLALRCALILIFAGVLARPSVDAMKLGPWVLAGVLFAALLFAAIVLAVTVIQRRGKLLIGGSGIACSVLAMLLVAVAAQALHGGASPGLGNERAPVAAALVVDTSVRMDYLYENRTRLDEGREMALWLLGQLPRGSEISVLDSRFTDPHFSVDIPAAKKAIERLQISAAAEPITATVGRAVELLEASEKVRHEVYVITDLTRAAWPTATAERLRNQIVEVPDLSLYVIDVGVLEPQNASLGDLELSAESLALGNELRISTEIQSVGAPDVQAVDLFLEVPDEERPVVVNGETLLPKAVRRDQIVAESNERVPRRVEFRLAGLPVGVHQGTVRLRGSDALPVDNTRYFAVEVRSAWPVLVSAPSNVEPQLFIEAITPSFFRQARFEFTLVDPTELPAQDLSAFAGVCLLDPKPLPPATWERLARYVSEGGGLSLFLGHNAYPADEFNSPVAKELVGGTLVQRWRAADRHLFLAPTRFNHPILAPFREQSTSVPWNDAPIFRHWVVDDLGERTAVLVPYNNKQAAVLETNYGAGRVLTFTTPVSDPLSPDGRDAWNELPTGDNAWPYLVLVNELVGYLVDDDALHMNYQVGEVVTLPNRSGPNRYRLFSPGDEPFDVLAHEEAVTVRYTERPGAYRLKGRDGPIVRGFAVNVPARATRLDRLATERLVDFLGEDRYYYARQRDEILLDVGQSRIGREFYPYLLTVLIVVVGLEHLLANRFYRETA
jgi:drug/metabolite transporter (DMT)-like permease